MIAGRSDAHLGELVAGLVDGALGHHARERCLAHLARCGECRAEVEAHRALKNRLASLTGPGCPDGLVDRLRRLPDAAPGAGGADDGVLSALPPVRLTARFRPTGGPARRTPTREAGARPAARSATRRLVATAAGVLVVFALTLATVVAVGGGEQPAPVTPPVGTFSVEHSRVSDTVPGGDPEAGWVDVVNQTGSVDGGR